MLESYFKTTLRSLQRNKLYSLTSIFGLAIGMTACALILQYVGFELSYDTFHQNAANLYRLTNDRYQNGELTQHGVITYPSVAKAMKADFPEVANYTRLIEFGRMYMRRDETGFDESVVFADSAFFGMFSFPLVAGDAGTALQAPYSGLLSESAAQKYFGSHWHERDILGEILRVDNRFDITITGVFKDIPANSHMKFDFLVSYRTLGQAYQPSFEDSWTNSNFMTYLQLAPGSDPKLLEQKFIDFSERYFRGAEVTSSVERFYLQSLTDIHLYSDYEYETWVHGNGNAVWGLLLVTGFIMLIAWVNYINLSTARSLQRAREVGIRKVVGAQKSQLVRQFLFESLIYNILGLLIAGLLLELLQPYIAELLGVNFSPAFLTNNLGLIFAGLFLTGMVLSGLYPAFLNSSFKTISVLTGKIKSAAQGQLIRKGLVIFQFALSFGAIAGTYAVYSQINYMMDQDLGINVDQVLVVQGPRLNSFDSTYFDNISSFKAEVMRFPGVVRATTSQRIPGNRTGRIFGIERRSGDSARRYTTSQIGIDYQFFETFGMEILAGRGFSRSDHNLSFNAVKSIVLNETALRLLGFGAPVEALGQGLYYWDKDWEIIGVVADHHQQSLHVPIEPIIFMPLYSTNSFFYFKVASQDLPRTIAGVKEKYLEFFPGNSFNSFFLDDYFNRQYEADQRFRTAFLLFASLGVLLACLGLFGLAFFTSALRVKEIGVRKVLGATTQGMIALLLKDFSRLIVLAAVLAAPLTYFAVNEWLTGYAYRISIDWVMFTVPGFILLIIALFTVSYHTLRVALTNPVETLRYE